MWGWVVWRGYVSGIRRCPGCRALFSGERSIESTTAVTADGPCPWCLCKIPSIFWSNKGTEGLVADIKHGHPPAGPVESLGTVASDEPYMARTTDESYTCRQNRSKFPLPTSPGEGNGWTFGFWTVQAWCSSGPRLYMVRQAGACEHSPRLT